MFKGKDLKAGHKYIVVTNDTDNCVDPSDNERHITLEGDRYIAKNQHGAQRNAAASSYLDSWYSDTWNFTLKYPTTIEEAALQLDAHCPYWTKKIQLSRLDQRSAGSCVLGQLYNDYYTGMDTLFNIKTTEDFKDNPNLDKIFGTNSSTEEWKRQIYLRLNKINEEPKAAKQLTFLEAVKALTEGKMVRASSFGEGTGWVRSGSMLHWVQKYQISTPMNATIWLFANEQWEILEKPEPKLTFNDLKAGEKFYSQYGVLYTKLATHDNKNAAVGEKFNLAYFGSTETVTRVEIVK